MTPTPDLSSPLFEDDTTGLPNRRYLVHHLQTRVAWDTPEHPCSLLLLDVDGFKKVNDQFPAEEADYILRSLAERLRTLAGSADVVGRYGGDSFLLVLPDRTKDQAVLLGELIRASLADQPLRSMRDKMKVALTLSGGVSTFPEDGSAMDPLIDRANRALFVSKRTGLNRISAAGRLDESIAAERDAFRNLPCPMFVDRKAELNAAAVVFEELREGRPPLLVVQGDAGCGKSRFLRELADRARMARILYMYVPCAPSRTQATSYALLDLFDRFFERAHDELVRLQARLTPAQRAILRPCVPAFAAWPGEIVEPPRDRNGALLQAVEATLRLMVEKSPLMLLLDNANHADGGTLEALRTVLKDGKVPLGVVMGLKGDVRTLDPRRHGALLAFCGAFEKEGRLQALTLPPLDRHHLLEMISAILPGASPPAEFVDTIIGLSKGNPLYTEEAIRSLMLRGRIKRPGGVWEIPAVGQDELPPSLDQLVKSVFDSLPEETNEILTNAAIVGAQFNVQVLQEVTGQQEAQTLDAMDRTMEAGLVRPLDEGNIDRMEFTSEHSRDVRYDTTPVEDRKKIHRRIAGVIRYRTLDPSQQQGAELAFHNAAAQGKESPPAEMPAAAGAPMRRARIPEGSTALSETALKRALEFVRGFVGLIKVGTLYPKGSQAAEMFRHSLLTATGGLLVEAESVTFLPQPPSLRINGQAVEPARGGEFCPAFANLLSERLVGSLTLARGLEDRELRAFADALASPMQKSAVPPDHWDLWLDRDGISHLDVAQRRYVGAAASGSATAERALVAEEFDFLWTALRYLKAAADNLKLYPTGHPLFEESLDHATTAFDHLLARAPSVTLASHEESLLVNGAPAAAAGAGDAALLILRGLADRGFKSVTFKEGMTPEEVRAFCGLFAMDDRTVAGALISGDTFRHLALDALTYQRVGSGAQDSAGGCPPASNLAEFPAAPKTDPNATRRMAAVKAGSAAGHEGGKSTGTFLSPAPGSRLDVRARAWLQAPVNRFLSESAEQEFTALLEALNFGAMAPLAARIVDRIGECLNVSEPEFRRRANVLLGRLITETTGETRGMIVKRTAKSLQSAVREELDAIVLRTLAGTLRCWTQAALSSGAIPLAADLLWNSVRLRLHSDLTSRDIKIAFSSRLAGLASLPPPHPALEALKSGFDPIVEAARKIISMIGAPMIAPLIQMIAQSERLEARRIAAEALKEIGGTASMELARFVRDDVPAEQACRVLRIIETVGEAGISTSFFASLSHPDPLVLAAAFELVKRAPRPVALAILRKAMTYDRMAVVTTALAAAQEMKCAELAPEVSRLLLTLPDEAAVRATLTFLAEYPTPEAVPGLQRIYDQRGRMFGLVKGFSSETRALAVSVASRIKHPEARALVQSAQGERDTIVRKAARSGPQDPTPGAPSIFR